MWEILGYIAGGGVLIGVVLFIILLVAYADGMGR